MYFIFCACRGKFKSERDDCDVEDGSNDVLVLGYEPAKTNYAGLGRIRKQKTAFVSFTSAVRSLASSVSPPTQHWSTFKKLTLPSSSVAPITDSADATVTQEPTSSAVRVTENNSTVERRTSKKIAGENVVQLLAKGVWVLRRLALNVCEVTFVHRFEDKGDIPNKIFNMKVSR